MYRITTPTHTFNLPFDTENISKLIITYAQYGKTILEKTQDDVIMLGKKIILVLTQEETELFAANKAKVQIRLKIGERVMASNILTIDVREVLNKEVL